VFEGEVGCGRSLGFRKLVDHDDTLASWALGFERCNLEGKRRVEGSVGLKTPVI